MNGFEDTMIFFLKSKDQIPTGRVVLQANRSKEAHSAV